MYVFRARGVGERGCELLSITHTHIYTKTYACESYLPARATLCTRTRVLYYYPFAERKVFTGTLETNLMAFLDSF